jgi:LysM repeat protein
MMVHFQRFGPKIRRKLRYVSLLVIVLLAVGLAALPTPAQAAPVRNEYGYGYGHGYQCGGGCYVVRPGDTLSQIALWYGVSLWALAKHNGIHDPSTIYVGQKIYIPYGDGGYHHKPDDGCGGCGHDGGYGHKPDNDCGGCGYHKPDNHCGGCGYDQGYHKPDNHCGGCGYDQGYHHANNDYGCGGCDVYKQPSYNNSGCFSCGYYGKPSYDSGCGGCGHHGGYGYYVVRPGDTLSRIAQWYGVDLYYLAYKNGIHDPSKIYVGQVIYL